MKAEFTGIAMALLLGVSSGVAFAVDSDVSLYQQSTRMDRYSNASGQTAVNSKTTADFSRFYGQDNAKLIAGGLRSGTEIHLVSYGGADGKTIISEANFTPPTGSMGNGNVYISMALARQQLINAGINQPTAEQIQTSMVGGTLVPGGQPVTGVLQMRASGMGWGQIAHSLGVNLGHVISGMKSANAALARISPQTDTPHTTGKPYTPKSSADRSGVVTAGGSNIAGGKGAAAKSGIVTGTGAAHGISATDGAGSIRSHGAGIVNGGGVGQGAGQGNAYGKGGK